MDNYKFGNALCELREKKNMTQRELAEVLEVSDKAVSKWENGQAIPRMNVLEKMAEVFGTSVEELIASGKDNIKRIYFHNSYSTALHIEINGSMLSLMQDEEKSVELESSVKDISVIAYGEFSFDDLITDEDKAEAKTKKEKRAVRKASKAAKMLSRFMEGYIIQSKCCYRLSDINDEEKIDVTFQNFSIGDKMWLGTDIYISYPEFITEKCKASIESAVCQNPAGVLSTFRTIALTSELGISIPLMLLSYPVRKAYLKKSYFSERSYEIYC